MPELNADNNKAEKLRRAVKYYYMPVRTVLVENGDFMKVSDVIAAVIQEQNINAEAITNSIHNRFVVQVLRDFVKGGWCELIADDFADQFVKANGQIFKIENSDPTFREIQERYQKLETSSFDWLRSALIRIASQFSVQDFALLKDAKSTNKSTSDRPVSSDRPEDHWEPLKIDRDEDNYKDALSASEAALREIESSNGYASAEPDERNGVVSTIKGTLEAVKTGAPSKQSVIHGLVKPLEYIAKKFAETTMGEIAKIAVTKLIAWLLS